MYVTGETPSDLFCLNWKFVNLQVFRLRKSVACYSVSFLCSLSFIFFLKFCVDYSTQGIFQGNPHFDHLKTDPVPDLLFPSTTAGLGPCSLKAS